MDNKPLLDALQQLVTNHKPEEINIILKRTCVDLLNILAARSLGEEEIIRYMKAALSIDNNDWTSWANLAHFLNTFDHYNDAADAAAKAIKLAKNSDQECLGPIMNHAIILTHALRLPEAIEIYRQILSKTPDNAAASYNLACILLMIGEYKEGWEKQEHRFKGDETTNSPSIQMATNFRKRFPQPFWKGEKLNKERLCIFNEQGYGDLIQCSRFLSLVQDRVKDITVEVQEECVDLFKHNFSGIKFVGRSATCPAKELPNPPDCDVCISINSLMRIFDVCTEEQMRREPYIKADKKISFPLKTTKIGICWAGSSTHGYDHLRSCYLREFKKLSDLPNITLMGLQKGHQPRVWYNVMIDLKEKSNDVKFIDVATQFHTFSDTAAWVNNMDLIVTVDTSIAHLAGAMGKPTWMLLPTVPDWRWQLNKEDTPWYSSVRLFRQTKIKEWDEVFSRVAEEIKRTF